MKEQAYIVDIDGTLACGSHRQQYVRTKPKNWNAYNAGMHLDLPIEPVIITIHALSLKYKIVVCSGRQDKDKTKTLVWFNKHGVPCDEIYMRKTNDFRDDTIVKEEMLQLIKEKYDIIAVFDDRTKVVDMWRRNGLYVFDTNRTREDF